MESIEEIIIELYEYHAVKAEWDQIQKLGRLRDSVESLEYYLVPEEPLDLL